MIAILKALELKSFPTRHGINQAWKDKFFKPWSMHLWPILCDICSMIENFVTLSDMLVKIILPYYFGNFELLHTFVSSILR